MEYEKENIQNNGAMGWITGYLNFKEQCTKQGIKDIIEIIKLWEVRINSLLKI